MNESKRALVVGAGTMGGGYARLFASRAVPGVELAGVVDLIPERAQAVASANGADAYTDLYDAIHELKPDFAYVATPDALHRGPVETLAAAGIPLLVEKPLATTVEDGDAMIQAVERAGIHAEVNYSNRWNPPFVEARRVVDSGEAGEIRSFNVRLNNTITSPETDLSWSASTTPAWFLMSHCLDLAHWLSGRTAVSVYATAGYGVLADLGVGTPDWIHATVRYEGGGDGVFEAMWILPDTWPGTMEFVFRAVGSKAAIDVDVSHQNIVVTGLRHHYPVTLNWAQQRVASFLQALDGHGRMVVSFPDAMEVTRILVAAHRSIESGAVEPVRT